MAVVARLSRFILDASDLKVCEQNLYFDFITRAGDLLPSSSDSWMYSSQCSIMAYRLACWIAKRMAINALAAAAKEKGPFQRHPLPGLVLGRRDKIRRRLERIAS